MERRIIAVLSVDDDKAFWEIDDGPIPYLERELGWLEQSLIFLKDAYIADEDYVEIIIGEEHHHHIFHDTPLNCSYRAIFRTGEAVPLSALLGIN